MFFRTLFTNQVEETLNLLFELEDKHSESYLHVFSNLYPLLTHGSILYNVAVSNCNMVHMEQKSIPNLRNGILDFYYSSNEIKINVNIGVNSGQKL